MADYQDLAKGDGRKLSRIERQKQKVLEEKAKLDKLLAVEKDKQRKGDTRDKILLGVILQGLIVDGLISAESFDKYLDKYLTNDKDRERCDTYYARHSTWKPK
jgi:hypothetical protein